jgi:hypothetical protein
MTEKKIELKFMPGCFDNFDGSQEELNELMSEIQRLVDTGEIFEKSVPLDLEELDEEEQEVLMTQISNNTPKRNLQ